MKTRNWLIGMAAAMTLTACGNKNKTETTVVKPVETKKQVEAPQPQIDSEVAEAAEAVPTLHELILFEFDSSDLTVSARNSLAENAQWLQADPSRRLTIEGHTDEQGTTGYNLALGERRARIAKNYLVRLGVSEARISFITYGEERPVSSDDADNRRSVFVSSKK